jgi:hypothetical protein
MREDLLHKILSECENLDSEDSLNKIISEFKNLNTEEIIEFLKHLFTKAEISDKMLIFEYAISKISADERIALANKILGVSDL